MPGKSLKVTAGPVTRSFPNALRYLGACAVICCATASSQAATIIKLNLGNTGPDIGTVGGVLQTTDDGNAATTGNQNSAIDFVGPLSGFPDVPTSIASFSLGNLTPAGNTLTVGSLAIQNYTGGTFSLFDPANVLLLSGTLGNSSLAGTIGVPGTGSVFSSSFATATGGTLAPLLVANSLSLSIALTEVNGGAGFAVSNDTLQPFLASASVDIAADLIPEPASMGMLAFGVAALVSRRRK